MRRSLSSSLISSCWKVVTIEFTRGESSLLAEVWELALVGEISDGDSGGLSESRVSSSDRLKL